MSHHVVPHDRLHVRRTLRRGVALCRRELRLLLAVALIIEVPVAILTVGSVAVIDPPLDPGLRWQYAFALLLLTSWAALGHHALLAVVERIEAADRAGHTREHLRVILRGLPYGRFIVAHIVVTAALELGLAAFVIPGVVVAVWTAPVFPLLTMERRSVRDTIRRSFAIVRGNAWPLFAVMLFAFVLVSASSLLVTAVIHEIAHSNAFAALGHAAIEAFLAPIGAALTVNATFDLVAIDAAARRGSVAPV